MAPEVIACDDNPDATYDHKVMTFSFRLIEFVICSVIQLFKNPLASEKVTALVFKCHN